LAELNMSLFNFANGSGTNNIYFRMSESTCLTILSFVQTDKSYNTVDIYLLYIYDRDTIKNIS